MNSYGRNKLTTNEFSLIIFGSIVEIAILRLPIGFDTTVHQDGWISTALGVVYPLYMLLVGIYIINKEPNEDILKVSKKCFGKIIGNIVNTIFLSYFIFYCSSITSGYSNIITTYANNFISVIKLLVIVSIMAMYTASKGIKVIAKICIVTFYITIIIMVISIGTLKNGSILNLMPIMQYGPKELIISVFKCIYAYTGIEIMFLLYPQVEEKEKNKIKDSVLKIIFIVLIIYVWLVFITFYYLGDGIVNKSSWPFLLVIESVNITVINNFRFIFIFLLSFMAIRSISIQYYAATYTLNSIFNKVDKKILNIITMLVVISVCLMYGNESSRRIIIEKVIRFYVPFNITYITLIAFILKFKKGEKCE